MRIAYLTQSYPPMISGAALMVQKTAEAMAERGHQVLVIAASDREYPYHSYKDNLTVLRLSSYNNPLRVGQRMMLCPIGRIMGSLKHFLPDIIHVHDPLQIGMLGLEYAKHAQIPVTVTAHQLPWFVAAYLPQSLKSIAEKLLWFYARMVMKKFTTVIAPTQTIATVIGRAIRLRSSVINYGLELQTFHPAHSPELKIATRVKWGLPVNAPIILHVGRLDIDKRVDKIIRAASQPIRESDADLLIVGDGSQKNHLIDLCKELSIESRAHFTGFIVPAELPEIYRVANIFITASEIETQGIVLYEAAASGLPIIAVNATCVSEIVHDCINGFLVNSRDVNDLRGAIRVLLDDPKRAYSMGREGRFLAENYDIQHTWTLHEKLYQKMTEQVRIRPTLRKNISSRQWKTFKKLIGLK